jgi:hypothetical protein
MSSNDDKKPQGFAALSEAQRKIVSAKGGRKQVKKGLAMLTPEQRQKNASDASKKRWDKVKAERQKAEQQKEVQNGAESVLPKEA